MSHTENEASSGKETAEDPKGAADVSEAEMGRAGRGGKPSANEAGSPAGRGRAGHGGKPSANEAGNPAGKRNGSGTARPAVILGGAVAFLVGCDSMVVAPIAPEILESWGASASLSALLVAAYALAYAATSPFFGALADYRGRRPVAVAGLAVFGAGTALTFAAPNLAMGLACRALAGLGAGMVMPTVFGEVVSRSTPQTRGANVGVVTGMLLSATVVGVPIGSLLASAVGWQWTFLLIAIPGFLAMFPAVRVFSGVGRQTADVRAGDGKSATGDGPRGGASAAVAGMLKAALTHRGLLFLLLSTGLWHAGFAVAYTSIGAFYEDRYGFGAAEMSWVTLAAGAAGIVGAVVGGRLLARWHAASYTAVAGGAAALGVTAVVFSPGPVAVTVLGQMVWSVGVVAAQPAFMTLAATLNPRLQGTALALNGAAQYFAQFIASSAGAAILTATGSFAWLGGASAALAAISAIVIRGVRTR